MANSIIDAESMLVVEVGSVTTRAMLFDVVDSRYRFLAAGASPSTAGAPFHDVGEGMRHALDQLQAVTGRTLTGSDERLVMPGKSDGSGVDMFAAALSAGAPLKVVVVGLLDDVSLESARRLASAAYPGPMEIFSLSDRRSNETRISAILKLRPDIIIVAGGTEGGASQSILKLLEPVGLACYLLPDENKPYLLYAGNQNLQDEVQTTIGKLAHLEFAPNVRPELDYEQLDPAQARLSGLYSQVRARQLPGVSVLNEWAGGGLVSSAAALGRIMRYYSIQPKYKMAVLGLDVGASATTLAAAYQGALSIAAYPQFGLGSGLLRMLETVSLDEIARWLPVEVSAAALREYLYNKALFPASLPVTAEELAIEQAVTRQAIFCASRQAAGAFPTDARIQVRGQMPWFDPIFLSGSVFANAPSYGQAMLMLLDGLQPIGTAVVGLDQHHLLPALGAAAAVNPLLVKQVLESNALLQMGTVIVPVSNAKPDTPILRLKLTEAGDNGATLASLEVKQGTLEVLPLPAGQVANLQVQPLYRTSIGNWPPGRGGARKPVIGGPLGVIIDARGRPLRLPEDAGRRRELIKKWLWTLGG